MAKFSLKFGERALQDYAVGARPVTIGRLPDNTIVIQNPAVSGRHARVLPEGQHFVLEDLKSTNGTFVNDKPIARHTLVDGDVVLIGKHTLVFVLAGAEEATAEPTPEKTIEVGGTMALDATPEQSRPEILDYAYSSEGYPLIPKTAIPAPPPRTGSVRVVSGKTDRPEYTLTAMTTIIGKADNAQIRTKGWFKPKLSAAIARKGDGFTLSPMGAAVAVNNQKVGGRQALQDGDIIEVSGLTLEFRLV